MDFFDKFTRKAKLCADGESAFSDRMFISVKNNPVTMEGKDNTSICRYEFFESLVRIAQQKYFDTGLCESVSDALKRTIEEDILKNFPLDGWQEFRNENPWLLHVSDVLFVNKDGIMKLMTSKFYPRQNWLSYKGLVELICKDASLNIVEADVRYCYGMSKMTVVNEAKSNYKTYFKVHEAEFMEFLVRLAS